MQLELNLPTALAATQSLFIDHGAALTTSRAVAERFGKRHRDVLKAIKNLLDQLPNPAFAERNFALSSYLDPTGRTLPEYRLTHDGFALLAMRFTGPAALAWQIAFIEAFNGLEAELRAQVDRDAAALAQLRPHWLTIRTCTDAGLDRRQICAQTGHRSPATITANRARMRALGVLPGHRLPVPLMLGLNPDADERRAA